MDVVDRLRAVIGDSTIEQFAALMDEPVYRVKDILRGRQKPPADFLIKLQLKLGVDLNWLLAGAPGPPKPALTAREATLLDEYRAAAEEGRRAIEATTAAVSGLAQRTKDGGANKSVGPARKRAA